MREEGRGEEVFLDGKNFTRRSAVVLFLVSVHMLAGQIQRHMMDKRSRTVHWLTVSPRLVPVQDSLGY